MVGLIRGRSDGGAWGLLCVHSGDAGAVGVDAIGEPEECCKANDVMYNAALVRWATGQLAQPHHKEGWGSAVYRPAGAKFAAGR